MSQIVNEMIEKGQLHQLSKKWELKQPNCQPAQRKGTPISFGKLTTLFLEIALGVLLTMILLFAEKMHSIYKSGHQQQSVFRKTPKTPGYNDALKKMLKDIKDVLQRHNINNVDLNLLIEKTDNKLK